MIRSELLVFNPVGLAATIFNGADIDDEDVQTVFTALPWKLVPNELGTNAIVCRTGAFGCSFLSRTRPQTAVREKASPRERVTSRPRHQPPNIAIAVLRPFIEEGKRGGPRTWVPRELESRRGHFTPYHWSDGFFIAKQIMTPVPIWTDVEISLENIWTLHCYCLRKRETGGGLGQFELGGCRISFPKYAYLVFMTITPPLFFFNYAILIDVFFRGDCG